MFREYEQTTSFLNSIQREIRQVSGVFCPNKPGIFRARSWVDPRLFLEHKERRRCRRPQHTLPGSASLQVGAAYRQGRCPDRALGSSTCGRAHRDALSIKKDRIDPDRRCLIVLERRGRDIAELVAVLVVPVTYNGSEIIQAPA